MRTRTYEIAGPMDSDRVFPYRLVYEEAGRRWFVTEPNGRTARFRTRAEAEARRETLVPSHEEAA